MLDDQNSTINFEILKDYGKLINGKFYLSKPEKKTIVDLKNFFVKIFYF